MVDGDSTIRVIQPYEDEDLLHDPSRDEDRTGPLILRIERANTVLMVGKAPRAGRVAWRLSSFITATQNTIRTMEFNPSTFVIGSPYVVDAALNSGTSLPCPTSNQSAGISSRLAEFDCGVTTWLTPLAWPDPITMIGWLHGSPESVRVQNGIYQRYRPDPVGPDATPATGPIRGFYVVFPFVKFDRRVCFECDAGAVAYVYARLEPVPIP
jgi:hypothetical protein